MTTTTIPRGIMQLDHPCWTVVTHDGRPAGFEESEPHYVAQAEAQADARGYQCEDDPPVQVIQVPDGFRCTVAYLYCGKQYVTETDDGPSAHFADEQGVRDAIDNDLLVEVAAGVFACDETGCNLCAPYQLSGNPGAVAQKMTELAELVLQFGTVERATYHPDRKTHETDTTHTVMLGVIACALAARFFPQLDVGLIAQFALVHDLPEAHAGDTNTLDVQTEDQKQDKERRELAARVRLRDQFHWTFPWVMDTINGYEMLQTPEARFVKAVDKLTPKFTHLLTEAHLLIEQGKTRGELADRYRIQRDVEMSAYAADFPHLLMLHRVLADQVTVLLPEDGPR